MSKNSVWWHDNMGSTFQEVLQFSKSIRVHRKNILISTTEVHKVLNNIYPPIMKIFITFRKRQMPSQNFQKNEAAKNKSCIIWSQNSTLLRFTNTFSWNKVITCTLSNKNNLNAHVSSLKIPKFISCKLFKNIQVYSLSFLRINKNL